MKHKSYIAELEKERRELNRLIDDALKNGTPISQTYAIMEQSRKMNLLLDKIIEEKERTSPLR